jgi:hypothetical protein
VAAVRAVPGGKFAPEISADRVYSASFGAFGRGLAALRMNIVHTASRLGDSAASAA